LKQELIIDIGFIIAEFCHYYSGYTAEAVLKMPIRRFFCMRKQIPRLKAQTILDLCNATAYPHVKQEDAKKLIANYQKIVNPHESQEHWWENVPKGLQLVSKY
jgi:hypothetical protein